MADALQKDLGGLVERLDHVAIAVSDLASAARLMETIGATFHAGGDELTALFRWAQFRLPNGGKIELLTPLDTADADHFLVSFLERRGEGMHHITLKVSDLAAAIDVAEAAGYRTVGRDDQRDSWKEAFVHPKTAHGVLIQLAEWDDTNDRGPQTLEDVLRGTPDGYDD